jgi:NAD(P)-dependent dehydrogenase (short-subunit alcohol dehydrogenase family)
MTDQHGTAVVVGATGAVGSAMVSRFTAAGLSVLAVARRRTPLDELAAGSDLITPCVADIADNASIEAIAGHLNGAVRIAVMAAGLPVRGSADTIDPDLLGVGANVKLGGLVRLLHAVRGSLQRGSRFVAFAGTLGIEPRAQEAGPGAINAGVLNLMRQISLLYGPRGVTVHTICPGPADTPRLRRIAATVAEESGEPLDAVWQGYAGRTSLGRLPAADEIAWAVALLLQGEADIMHGGVLHLDGGGLAGIH